MSTTLLRAVFNSFPAIGLDGLLETAALEIRRDRKYVVPIKKAEALLARFEGMRALDIQGRRVFEYETTYFDTDALALFKAAARSRPKRHKVRTRSYLDSGLCALEVKGRDGRSRTVKHRMAYGFADRRRLTAAARRYVNEVTGMPGEGDRLRPVLTTRYRRRTLYVPVDDCRVTVDSDFCAVAPDGGRALLEDHVIIETKTNGRPGRFDRALWRAGYRQVRISKYGTGLAVARGLRANKWHTTIARYLTQ